MSHSEIVRCLRKFFESLTPEQVKSHRNYLHNSTNNCFQSANKNATNDPNLMLRHMKIDDNNYLQNILNSTVKSDAIIDAITPRIIDLHSKYGRGSIFIQCSTVSQFKQSTPDNIIQLAIDDAIHPIICWAVRYDPLFSLSDIMLWLPSRFICGIIGMADENCSIYKYPIKYAISTTVVVWEKYPSIPYYQIKHFCVNTADVNPQKDTLSKTFQKYFADTSDISTSRAKFRRRFPEFYEDIIGCNNGEMVLDVHVFEQIGFLTCVDDIVDEDFRRGTQITNRMEGFTTNDDYDIVSLKLDQIVQFEDFFNSKYFKMLITNTMKSEWSGITSAYKSKRCMQTIAEGADFVWDYDVKGVVTRRNIVSWYVLVGLLMKYVKKIMQYQRLKARIFMQNICAHCNRSDDSFSVKFKRCGDCKQLYYCSKKCQKADWNNKHRLFCEVYQNMTYLSFDIFDH
eukprot:6193_1